MTCYTLWYQYLRYYTRWVGSLLDSKGPWIGVRRQYSDQLESNCESPAGPPLS
jgi:hypothetical protein